MHHFGYARVGHKPREMRGPIETRASMARRHASGAQSQAARNARPY